MTKGSWRKILYYTHIWVGLLTAAFLVVYLLSGVFLNHKQFFHAMERWETQTVTLNPQQRAAGQEFVEARKELIAAMVKYTGKPQPDNIYVGGDGEVNFLDRSGKMLTFHVKPSGDTGVISQGYKKQPGYFLNNQLHRNGEMRRAWVRMSTGIAVAIFIVLLCGLLVMPWKRLEFILLLSGIALLLIGMYVAEIPFESPASAAITIPGSPTHGMYS